MKVAAHGGWIKVRLVSSLTRLELTKNKICCYLHVSSEPV